VAGRWRPSTSRRPSRPLGWLGAATGELEALRREKVEGILEADGEETTWQLYRDE
jgi:hypothetical protein